MAISSALGVGSLTPGVCTSTSRPANPFEGQLLYETDTDMLVIWNGSAWRYIASTTATNGTILQVDSATTAARTYSRSNTTYANITGLTVSITPKSTSSKVLVRANVCCGLSVATEIVRLQLARNGSAIGGGNEGSVIGETRATDRAYQFSMEFLDSPSSTSALTYSVQTRTTSTDYTFFLNRRGTTDLYNGISTITAMEIAG